MQLSPGAEVGPYTLERLLGRGGMGAVYAAVERASGRRVALKVNHEPVDGALAERFVNEARTAARVRHPNVVTVHDAGVDRGRQWLSMELVEGVALDQRLRSSGPLEPVVAARIALDLARALTHAHAQGVVHRDLKPANVILTTDGRPRLGDFGLAKDLERRDALTRTGELLGTPAYMAPEQLDAVGVGPAADVYGLGATLFALLTGEPPFSAESIVSLLAQVARKAPRAPSSLRPDVPPALDAVCLRCLRKAPADRYPTTEALADDLIRFLAGDGPRRRRRARRPALVALGLTLLGGAGVWSAVRQEAPVAPVAPETVAPIPSSSPAAPTTLAPLTTTKDALPPLRPRPRWSWAQRGPGELPARTILERTTLYDPERRAVVFFGGLGDDQQFHDDLWSWDGVKGVCLDAGSGGPAPLDGPGIAYDPDRRGLFLHGGARFSAPQELTWRHVKGVWKRAHEEIGPGPRGGPTLVWSPRAARALLFGGYGYSFDGQDDLWAWDGAAWTPRPARSRPPPRCYASAAWDARRGVLVMFGGSSSSAQKDHLTDLWELDGDVWRERRPRRGDEWPPETVTTAMTSDGDRVLLFVGGTLWAWTGELWERTPLPGPRTKKFGFAWDTGRDVGVLIGGELQLGGAPVLEVWELRKE